MASPRCMDSALSIRRWLSSSLLFAILTASPPSIGAAPPDRVWIALLGDRSIEEALRSGATLLDRLPHAVVVADANSADALRRAGLAVSEPIALPENQHPILLFPNGPETTLDDRTLAALGMRTLWRNGLEALVASPHPNPEDIRLAGFARLPLRSQPLRIPVTEDTELEKPLETEFAPTIQAMVDRVEPSTVMQWIEELSGTDSVLVGDSLMAFTTRYTTNPQCRLAEQYVFERFQALGYSDVQYDPYLSGGTTPARNVVATLPGVTRPGRIVILGAHLDSKSPIPDSLAPGANDNASGVAALLTTAAILGNYRFASTIRFIAFTGEEQGCQGSIHYAYEAHARGDSIIGMVNCDMLGWRYVGTNDVMIYGQVAWQSLMTLIDDAYHRYTPLGTHQDYGYASSDQVPFQNQGYPAALTIQYRYSSYPCYHQACDTSDRNDATFGAMATRGVMATVAQLAGPRGPHIVHDPLPSTNDASGPYEAVARIDEVAPLDPESLNLHYSTGWDYYQSVPLTSTGTPGFYHAFIPGQPYTTKVSYYLSAADTEGSVAASPMDAPSAVHEFYVGPIKAILNEDFEAGARQWVDGGSQNEWQVGPPRGLGGDPPIAHGGNAVCGTDLTGGGSFPYRYEYGSENWLDSPYIDCSNWVAVRLRFWRWLAVERSGEGAHDWARILVNGIQVWESPAGTDVADSSWTLQEIDVSSIADNNSYVRVRFALHSDFASNRGGWNLDDIRLAGIRKTTTTDIATELPSRELVLHPSAPNPLVTMTTLRFVLPAVSLAELEIFDVRGRLVRSLSRGVLPAREHRVPWDGCDESGRPVAAGVYVYRLKTPELTLSRKLVVVR